MTWNLVLAITVTQGGGERGQIPNWQSAQKAHFGEEVYRAAPAKIRFRDLPICPALEQWTVFPAVDLVAFCLLARILGECSPIHSLPAFFFFFFQVEISSRYRNQFTVAQRAKTTVAECSLTPYILYTRSLSLTSCAWSRSRTRSHTVPGQRYSQTTPTSLGQGSMCF